MLTEDGLGEGLRDDEHLRSGPRHDVGHRRVDRYRRVGDQGPGRRGPYQQGCAQGLQGAAGDREADVDAGVDHRLVALRDLMVRQPGPAARAVGRDAVVLYEQAPVVDLLERPPHRLDVARVHRAVGVVGVDPVRHPPGQGLKLTDVTHDRGAAGGVELRDPVDLDVALSGEAELLLDGELDRQPVAVPASLTGHVPALHGLEAREQVLEDPRLDVVRARLAVGRRRSLVEDPRLAVPGLLEAALEDPVTLPAGKHLVLERWQVDLGGELAHAGHAGCLRQWCSDEGTRLTPRGTTLLGTPLPARSCRAHVAQGVIFGLA